MVGYGTVIWTHIKGTGGETSGNVTGEKEVPVFGRLEKFPTGREKLSRSNSQHEWKAKTQAGRQRPWLTGGKMCVEKQAGG